MPYSKPLEDIAYPHEQQIVQAALEVLGQAPPQPPSPQAVDGASGFDGRAAVGAETREAR
jgi:hypothetical protein